MSIEGRAGETCAYEGSLEPATLIIYTPRRTWAATVAGGFTISGLTNPVYEINQTSGSVVGTDKGDDMKRGAGAFVHVYHQAWPELAPVPVFGLGIGSSDQSEYYFGLGVRLGDKAAINGGMVVGERAELPAGVNEGMKLTDVGALKELPTRVGATWFFGLSFSLIDAGDTLQRPFAGAASR